MDTCSCTIPLKYTCAPVKFASDNPIASMPDAHGGLPSGSVCEGVICEGGGVCVMCVCEVVVVCEVGKGDEGGGVERSGRKHACLLWCACHMCVCVCVFDRSMYPV